MPCRWHEKPTAGHCFVGDHFLFVRFIQKQIERSVGIWCIFCVDKCACTGYNEFKLTGGNDHDCIHEFYVLSVQPLRYFCSGRYLCALIGHSGHCFVCSVHFVCPTAWYVNKPRSLCSEEAAAQQPLLYINEKEKQL